MYCVYIKYRRPILNPGVQLYLRKLFPRVMQSLQECKTVEYSLQVDPIYSYDDDHPLQDLGQAKLEFK
jgi:hypothetical protein